MIICLCERICFIENYCTIEIKLFPFCLFKPLMRFNVENDGNGICSNKFMYRTLVLVTKHVETEEIMFKIWYE